MGCIAALEAGRSFLAILSLVTDFSAIVAVAPTGFGADSDSNIRHPTVELLLDDCWRHLEDVLQLE